MFCIEIIYANLRDWCNFKSQMVLLEHYHLRGIRSFHATKSTVCLIIPCSCLIQKMTQWSCRAFRIHLELYWMTSSIVFFNHELLFMAEILHQLRLVVYPIIYRVFYASLMAQAFFQYHQFPKWVGQGPRGSLQGRCWKPTLWYTIELPYVMFFMLESIR